MLDAEQLITNKPNITDVKEQEAILLYIARAAQSVQTAEEIVLLEDSKTEIDLQSLYVLFSPRTKIAN